MLQARIKMGCFFFFLPVFYYSYMYAIVLKQDLWLLWLWSSKVFPWEENVPKCVLSFYIHYSILYSKCHFMKLIKTFRVTVERQSQSPVILLVWMFVLLFLPFSPWSLLINWAGQVWFFFLLLKWWSISIHFLSTIEFSN